jgi:leishmanolysin-like peptidase
MAADQCEIKLLIFLLFSTHTYSHYLAEPGSIIRGVWSNGKHLLTRRNTDNSLKIKAYPDSSIQKLSSNLRELIVDRLLPDAIAYFGKTLSVRQRISRIRLQRGCEKEAFEEINGTLLRYCINKCKIFTYCGPVLIPEEHLDICRTCDSSKVHCTKETSKSTGFTNADFVLYISANVTSHCNNKGDVIAYASACQQEQTLDRPVAGFVNFCVEKLSRNFYYSHLLTFMKHEIFHALGFSSSLYGYYRADDGTPLTEKLSDGRPVTARLSDGRPVKWSNKVIN